MENMTLPDLFKVELNICAIMVRVELTQGFGLLAAPAV
jgi:hypothetical protein